MDHEFRVNGPILEVLDHFQSGSRSKWSACSIADTAPHISRYDSGTSFLIIEEVGGKTSDIYYKLILLP